MEIISIGIYDKKLKSGEQDNTIALEDYLTKLVPDGVSITCYSEVFDYSLSKHTIHKVVFAHVTDLPAGSESSIVEDSKDKWHLYWTSSDPQTSEDTLPDSSYEARGVDASLSDLEEYKELNWKEAFEEWRKKIDEWKNNQCHGAVPRFPLHILTEMASFPSITLPLVSLDILLQGYLAIWKPQVVFTEGYELFLGKLGIFQEPDMVNFARAKTQYLTYKDQRLFRPSNTEAEVAEGEPTSSQHLGWFWFDECLSDVKKHSYEDLRTCKQLPGESRLKFLWEFMRGECLGESDGNTLERACNEWIQDDFTSLFEDIYIEYRSSYPQDQKKKNS